jgi:hypothetical protein
MGAWTTLAYVAGAATVVILLSWLAGCCRSRKTRPTHEESTRPGDSERGNPPDTVQRVGHTH